MSDAESASPAAADEPFDAPAGDSVAEQGDGEAVEGAQGDGPPGVDLGSATVEELIELLERSTAERDEYLDALRRNQADFENYRKRAAKQVADDSARAVESLVEKLLPVLDACDAAVHHGAAEVEPVYASLLGTLEKDGLERISPVGEEFDPNRHEAVMHEPAEDGDEGTVVSDVMRAGYAWNGRVVRPAMVKVRG